MSRTVPVILAIVAAIVLTATVAFAALPPGGTFLDDDSNVHESNIEAIAAAAITLGCNPPLNDRFCPDQAVTRAEMAAFLSRALDLSVGELDSFADDDGSIFETDIERLAAAGITRGCNPPESDQFCPDRPVTRGEMAAFLVRAYGYTDQDFGRFVDVDQSEFVVDIERLAAAGITLGCNPPANDRFCPSQPVKRDQMASFLARAEMLSPIEVPPRLTPDLEALPFAFATPIQVTAPVGDDRIFVVERPGTVRIVVDGQMLDAPLLDITGTAIQGGERGLLSIAFHPQFAANGLVYASYSAETTNADADHRSVIEEFEVVGDVVDMATRRTIYALDQPFSNHNGGMIMFGPDGRLYLGLGDGGSANDPSGHGQNAATDLGSIISIEPASGDSDTFAIGVRNPWRWWIDGTDVYVADVGQSALEEISVVSMSDQNLNLGWDRYEGSSCTGSNCVTAGLTFPVIEYGHGEGCSITGGIVYRGALTQIENHFLYGDYCAGWIRTARIVDGVLVDEQNLTELGVGFGLTSFGVDGLGGTYVIRGGTVYELVGK